MATGLLPLTRVPAAALLVTWPRTRFSLSVTHTAPLCVVCAVRCLSVPAGQGAPRGQESCLLVEPADSVLVSGTRVTVSGSDRTWTPDGGDLSFLARSGSRARAAPPAALNTVRRVPELGRRARVPPGRKARKLFGLCH